MTFDQLTAIKATVMDLLKDKREDKKIADAKAKEELKEQLAANGRELCKIGNVIGCTFKENEVRGTITKINENTVSVSITDLEGNAVLNKDGKTVKTWKYLYQIFEV